MEIDSAQTVPSRILIADDNVANRELLEAYLSELNCETEIAEDGQQTLERIAEFKPDLVLLDVMMPNVDGYQTIKLIKQNEKLYRNWWFVWNRKRIGKNFSKRRSSCFCYL